MAFDLISWAIGYSLKKGLDNLFTENNLISKLEKRVIEWSKSIPSDIYVCPDTLFLNESHLDPNLRPALYSLRQILLDNRIPTEPDWLKALLEQWRWIRSNVKETQAFFQLEESIAENYLNKLAKSLSDECKQDEKLFHISVINILKALSIYDFNWDQIKQNAKTYLTNQLDLRKYQRSQDVKQDDTKNILSLLSGEKQILIISGNSGQGKSWLMYSAALSLSSNGEIAILVEASGDTNNDIQTATDIFWHEFRNNTIVTNMRGIIASLRQSGQWKKHWLTLFFDGVQNKYEILELMNQPWKNWGIKLVISCLPEMAEIVADKSTDFNQFKTNGFTVPELHSYLRLRLQSNWYGIPSNVMKILHKPLLAKLYCDLAKGKSWQPQNEYELFDKYWSRIDNGISLDSAKLKNLVSLFLEGIPYPWSNNYLLQTGLDNETLIKFIKLGWIQKVANGYFEISHDRLLNWAVAESLLEDFKINKIDQTLFCKQLTELYKSEHTYSGKYLGYVSMDVIWMAVSRDNLPTNIVRNIIKSFEEVGWPHKKILYSQLLPTIGPKILSVLFQRLESVIEDNDNFSLNLVINAITSFSDGNITTLAQKFLMGEQPLLQRAAMKIFSRKPNESVLNRLWELHCKIMSSPESYTRDGESSYYIYHDSFGALNSCVKLNPAWLEQKINSSPVEQPIDDLAYLLANLNNGKNIWDKCKKILFNKVHPSKARCLATNISQYCDDHEIPWLLQNIDKTEDLIGASALHALIKINPDLAVKEFSRLPIFELYLTREWCFYELLLKKPKETYLEILNLMKHSTDAWLIADIFQKNENLMNEDILHYLLDSLETLLDKELKEKQPENTNFLFRPLLLLSEIYRLELLKCFQDKSKTQLEKNLTSWLLQRGPRSGITKDSEQECAMNILYKINGSGFINVINSWLYSDNCYGNFDGIKLTVKRYDQQTLDRLIQITQQDKLWDNYPLIQEQATFVLAQLEQVDAVIEAILKWGLKTSKKVTHWKLNHLPINNKVLSDINNHLESKSEVSPGVILALGIAQRKEYLNIVRKVLFNAPNQTDITRACILTLGRLQDDLPETIESISMNLEIEKNRYIAKNALFQIGNDLALNKLLNHLKKQYDESLAVNLLEYENTFDEALDEIKKYLEKHNDNIKLEMLNQLYRISPDHKALNRLLVLSKYQDVVRSALYIDEESSSWHEGLKANAISILATFDKEAAFEAACATLKDTRAHDRDYYPYIMINIDKQRAISFLLIQLGLEESYRVIRAISTSLDNHINSIVISKLLDSSIISEKLTAIHLIGWNENSFVFEEKLKEYLNEGDERINLAIRDSLRRIFMLRESNKLFAGIKTEYDMTRKWIYLDSLLAISDPGDKHIGWPNWTLELFEILPSHMQHYLNEKMKERMDQFSKELVKKEERLQKKKTN